jgi:hypothetical protein
MLADRKGSRNTRGMSVGPLGPRGILSERLIQRTWRDDESSGLAPCRAHFRLYRPTSSTLTTIRPWMAFRKSALVFRGGRETSVSRA